MRRTKHPTSFYLSPRTREQLSELAERTGMNKSELVSLYIDRAYREETMNKAWTLYLSEKRLSAARAALRASDDVDAREEGLARLRNAEPGYLYNLLPDDHPDSVRARRIVADALLSDNQ